MFRTHRWIRVLPVTGCCAIGGGWIWTRPPGCAHAISRKRTRPAAPKTPHNRVRSTEQIKPPHARGPSPSSGPQDHHSTARVRLVTDKRHMASRATDPTCGISTPQRGLDSNAPAPPSGDLEKDSRGRTGRLLTGIARLIMTRFATLNHWIRITRQTTNEP